MFEQCVRDVMPVPWERLSQAVWRSFGKGHCHIVMRLPHFVCVAKIRTFQHKNFGCSQIEYTGSFVVKGKKEEIMCVHFVLKSGQVLKGAVSEQFEGSEIFFVLCMLKNALFQKETSFVIFVMCDKMVWLEKGMYVNAC